MLHDLWLWVTRERFLNFNFGNNQCFKQRNCQKDLVSKEEFYAEHKFRPKDCLNLVNWALAMTF